MKTIRVFVLLLTSAHVFTPVSTDQVGVSQPTKSPTTVKTMTKSHSVAPTAPAAPTTASRAPVTGAPPAETTRQPAQSTKTVQVATTAAAAAATPVPISTRPNVTSLANVTTEKIAPTEAAPNNSTQPRSAGSQTDRTTNRTGGASSTLAPPQPDNAMPRLEKDQTTEKSPGPQVGNGNKEQAKAATDKRLWWILLPVLLAASAALIILKFKCKKVHDHSETIDTGTENASFQARPESTKDGVMLLGVKSSGGDEEPAAAR